jgi:hypothetical protein
MRIRYITYLALALAAGFLVVATYGFAPPTISDLALGVGIGMLVVAGGLAGARRHDPATVAISGVIGALSAFMIVASQVFPQATVDNLTFALALGIGGLAVIGLTVNEYVTERVVHRLEVHERDEQRTGRREPIAA